MILCFSVFFFSAAFSTDTETLNSVAEQTEDLYRTHSGSEAATFNTVGKSMWAWGIGLAAAIAILSAAIHQSGTPENSNTTSK